MPEVDVDGQVMNMVVIQESRCLERKVSKGTRDYERWFRDRSQFIRRSCVVTCTIRSASPSRACTYAPHTIRRWFRLKNEYETKC